MKEPDINLIMNKLGISGKCKFIGYVIRHIHKDDFLFSYTGKPKYCLRKDWVLFPDIALRFDSYYKALRIMQRLGINDSAVIVLAFDFGSEVGVIDMPSCSEMLN